MKYLTESGFSTEIHTCMNVYGYKKYRIYTCNMNGFFLKYQPYPVPKSISQETPLPPRGYVSK